jgi:hypothetical protein
MRKQKHELRGLSGIGDRNHDVGTRDHPQVAVARFGWMQEKPGSPRAGKSRSNLPSDVPRLAHPRDDHATVAREANTAGSGKSRIQARCKYRKGPCFDFEGSSPVGQQL